MNRRSFLAALIAGSTLDPERLLWVPGRKKIFIPPPVLPGLLAFNQSLASREFEAAWQRYLIWVQRDNLRMAAISAKILADMARVASGHPAIDAYRS